MQPTLSEVLPQFAFRLMQMLGDDRALASSVPALRVYDRCRFGSPFCTVLYTQPRAIGVRQGKHRGILFADPNRSSNCPYTLIADILDDQRLS
jgi:hypothetical protein